MSDLDRLVHDLGEVPGKVAIQGSAVVHRGANNVVRSARELVSGLAHAPHYPAAIGYDMDYAGGAIAADIGPDKDKPQGALGNLLEYGSENNEPVMHLGPSLEREADAFQRHAADLATDVL